jgi:hypothetical protein
MIDYKISRIVKNDRLTKVWYRVYRGSMKDRQDSFTKATRSVYCRDECLEEGRLRLSKDATMEDINAEIKKLYEKDTRQ